MFVEFIILVFDRYPLYPTANLSAFRYGFYLLNRNIGQVNFFFRFKKYSIINNKKNHFR
jgi:hypothetical protein